VRPRNEQVASVLGETTGHRDALITINDGRTVFTYLDSKLTAQS